MWWFRMDSASGTEPNASTLSQPTVAGTVGYAVTRSVAGLLGGDSDTAMLFPAGATWSANNGVIVPRSGAVETQQITVLCLVNQLSIDLGTLKRVVNYGGTNPGLGEYNWRLRTDPSTGAWAWGVLVGGVQYTGTFGGMENPNNTVMIGGLYDGTSVVGIRNNVLTTVATIGGGSGAIDYTSISTAPGLGIGIHPLSDPSDMFNGVIDEVLVFPYALTSAQINSLYVAAALGGLIIQNTSALADLKATAQMVIGGSAFLQESPLKSIANFISLLPQSWWSKEALQPGGVTYTLIQAISGSMHLYKQSQLQYVIQQLRIATATGANLDNISLDFLGLTLPRLMSETDPAFRARIVAAIIEPKITYSAITEAIVDYVTTLTPPPSWVTTVGNLSPVGWWRMNSTSGTEPNVASGGPVAAGTVGSAITRGSNGLVYNGTDTAMLFTGAAYTVNDLVSVPRNVAFETNSFSAVCFVQLNAINLGPGNTILQYGGYIGFPLIWSLGVVSFNNPSWIFQVNQANGQVSDVIFGQLVGGAYTPKLGRIFMLGVVYDAINHVMNGYVNGQGGFATTVTGSSPNWSTLSAGLGIGGSPYSYGGVVSTFPGTIDEVILFPYALSAANMMNLFTNSYYAAPIPTITAYDYNSNPGLAFATGIHPPMFAINSSYILDKRASWYLGKSYLDTSSYLQAALSNVTGTQEVPPGLKAIVDATRAEGTIPVYFNSNTFS
jgi:hypothetical protein